MNSRKCVVCGNRLSFGEQRCVFCGYKFINKNYHLAEDIKIVDNKAKSNFETKKHVSFDSLNNLKNEGEKMVKDFLEDLKKFNENI